jgi:hypothetical protein
MGIQKKRDAFSFTLSGQKYASRDRTITRIEEDDILTLVNRLIIYLI